jgi:hypothetical protein
LGGVKVGDGLEIDGSGALSVHEPQTDHNYLNGLQGGDSTSTEFYHLTSEEHIVAQNTSGVNTGDQFSSDFYHNDLSGLQGGDSTSDEYYHLTSEEHTTVQNTSGVNTGDQNDHNLLDNIQGGDSTSNEYYHLTSEEHDRINPATDTTLGVVKIGNGLTIEGDGTLNAVDPILNHNLLEGLQGGDSTSSEFYHLTEVEYNDLQQILYLGEWRT